MIYELAYVLRTETSEEDAKKVANTISDAINQFEGEVLVQDAWGVRTFAQPTAEGVERGNYFYCIYQSATNANEEVERKLRISEDVLKFMVVKLGDSSEKEALLKAYTRPNLTSGEDRRDLEKDRKMFSKRKSCWFSANKVSPDWKDTSSYSWLVNEFGKISPARVTGLRPKYQRLATNAIKRGRCMGLISYTSNQVAR